ncbi:MAG: caspase family protein [Saprospiraceae bacterium]|nr:caspase family protein [Saprospiraceae bacterium]
MDRGIGPVKGNTKNKSNGRNFLFAIGIDAYHHWPKLNNAVKDIEDISQVLIQQYQFDTEDVFLITNEEATEANIYRQIRELKRKVTEQDNLLFLYSGHGHYDSEFDEGYWVPIDAHQDTEDRYISNSNIIKRVNAIETHHTLLIVDSCFSGTLVVQKRAGLVDEAFRSRRILTSGRQETVADGAPGENSPFAAGIITYLKKNTEKAINTTSLVQYVKSYVHGKAQQTPVEGRIQNSADEGGEFIFHLKVAEGQLWEQVLQKGTLQDFENYLDYFPEGQYAEIARREVLSIKEDDIWKSTLLKDNELAYQTYIQKYLTAGKYLAEARERLAVIKAKHEERKELLEQMAKEDAERDQIERKFKDLVQEAEDLYRQKRLQEAREKYRRSLEFHLPNFVPSYQYIEEQINLCHSGMKFLEYYQEGQLAMQQQNFKLALQYFNEALKIDNNPKVEELVRHCRQKRLIQERQKAGENRSPQREPLEYSAPPPMEEALTQTTYTAPPVQVQQKKKSRNWMWWGIGAAVVGIVILAGLSAGANYEDPGFLDDPTEMDGGSTYDPTGDSDVRTNGELIIGTWELVDMTSNGQSLSQNYPGAIDFYKVSYTFHRNGTMQGFSTTGSDLNNYSVSGNTINISSPVFGGNSSGWIQQLDDTYLTISFAMYNQVTGTNMPIVFEYERME